jgi:hypothetical protein
VVDQIENRLVDSKNRWLRLGEGPLPGNQLDQLELVTNVVLGWLALTGVIAFIGGLSLLLRRDAPARSAPPPAWPQQYPPQPYAGYAPGPGGYPPPGPPAPPSDRGSRPDW